MLVSSREKVVDEMTNVEAKLAPMFNFFSEKLFSGLF